MKKYGRLNLFNGYSHIENNVSRIFARILRDNQYVLDEFIKLIREKSTKEFNEIAFKEINNDSHNVEFQKTIADVKKETIDANEKFDQYDTIIGVALTPIEGAETINIDSVEVSDDDRKEGITDIVIEGLSNTYVLIECKNVEDDAIKQTKSYLKQICGEIIEDNQQIVSVSWTEIIEILQRYSDNRFNQDVIIEEYLEWLKNKYITWFPAVKFSRDNEPSENLKRLKSAIKCIDILKSANSKIEGTGEVKDGAVVNLSNDFERNMYFTIKNNKVYMESCLADTKAQMNLLLKQCKPFKFLDLASKDGEYKAEVVSYIKVADAYGGGIDIKQIPWLDMETFKDYKDKYCNRIDLLDIKQKSDKFTKLPKEFQDILSSDRVVKSNRAFVNISCGYLMKFTFDWDMIMDLDKNYNYCMSNMNDEVAKYLIEFIDEIQNKYIC